MSYVEKILNKMISRKLIVLIVSIGLFLWDGVNFNGNHLVIVFGIFLGVETLQKFVPGGK